MRASRAMRLTRVAAVQSFPGPGPRAYMIARIRWTNVLATLAAAAVIVVVIAWPLLAPAAPQLPPGPPRSAPAAVRTEPAADVEAFERHAHGRRPRPAKRQPTRPARTTGRSRSPGGR